MSFFDNKNYWIQELGEINSNLPKKRIKLIDLLNKKEKSFDTKNGIQIIPDEEINSFKRYFSSDMYHFIALPIIILQKKDFFVTSGNKYDTWIVERLLDYEKSNTIISIQNYIPKHTFYYAYQINRIKRIFPTLIQVIYSI